MTAKDDLIATLLSTRWPDGSLDGMPSRRIATMLADTLTAAGYVKAEPAPEADGANYIMFDGRNPSNGRGLIYGGGDESDTAYASAAEALAGHGLTEIPDSESFYPARIVRVTEM